VRLRDRLLAFQTLGIPCSDDTAEIETQKKRDPHLLDAGLDPGGLLVTGGNGP
jgi:hypothetical protein